MSSIIVTRGLPLGLMFRLRHLNEPANLNDGDWDLDLSLRRNTVTGPEAFPISGTAANSAIHLELTPEQTMELDFNENHYVLVIKLSKIDGTVNIRNTIQIKVVNDL